MESRQGILRSLLLYCSVFFGNSEMMLNDEIWPLFKYESLWTLILFEHSQWYIITSTLIAVIALEVSGDPMIQRTDVSLQCGDNLEVTEIHWRKNGQNIHVKGNHIDVTIHAMLGGNFTCHNPSGEVLNHTLLLVKPVDFEKVILTQTDKGNQKDS